MKWGKVNLEEALQAERLKSKSISEEMVLQTFLKMLRDDDHLDSEIISRIFGTDQMIGNLKLENLEGDKIFHLSEIKRLCTNYRLRFLDGKHFKGEIPYEAISKIKELQRSHNEELSAFKILAPSPMFNLQKKDSDPLLFIPLGNNRFYLIHKWGNDLSPYRKWVVLPFRNFKSLIATVALFTLVIVLAIPDSVYMGPYDQSSGAIRVIFFFYLFIAFSGLTVLYGFSRVKNFNSALWDSKYMD